MRFINIENIVLGAVIFHKYNFKTIVKQSIIIEIPTKITTKHTYGQIFLHFFYNFLLLKHQFL